MSGMLANELKPNRRKHGLLKQGDHGIQSIGTTVSGTVFESPGVDPLRLKALRRMDSHMLG